MDGSSDAARAQRLLEAGRALVARLDVEEVLEQLLETARELTGARYAAIGVLDDHRVELERFLVAGVDAETQQAIGELPRGRGVLGVLIKEPRPLRLADVGAHPSSYGFPPGHPRMTTFLGVPVLLDGRAWGNLYLTEKAGGREFSEGDEGAAVVLAQWAGIAISNARLYAVSERRRGELERAVRGLEATTAIARAIGSETELGRVLELIVKRGRALLDARALVLLLEDGEDLVIAAAAGQVDSRAHGARLTKAGSAAGEALMSGLAQRVSDVALHMSLADERLGVAGAETALLVPLVHRGAPLGVLVAFDRLSEDPLFGDEDEALAQAFAASAATAVTTAKSVAAERLRESLEASERERRRWARELHDETLQALGGLRVQLSSALRRGDPAALEAPVRHAVEQLEQEIFNLRTLITELRPAALDELGLPAAIDSLAQRVGAVSGLHIDAHVDLPARLAPELETAVYRIVQEALNNVVKHAGAERVQVHVGHADGDVLAVEVADDGQGFEARAPSEGFGLGGMRERASLLGGSLTVTSSAAGTTVGAQLPAQPAASSTGDFTISPPAPAR